jgi:predicted ATP-dependent serine protease
VFPSLAEAGTSFMRGQLALICAAPGAGKSAFMLTYALKAKVPTLYLSADSDAFTQVSRSVSILTGRTLKSSMEMVRQERLNGATELLDSLPIAFKYDASPSLQQIEDPLEAFVQMYGEYPALVVADNITNIRTEQAGDDDPFSGLEGLMDYLHDMARKTESCVIGLHHVTGSYNNGDQPIPLSGVKGQIARVPELVISLHRTAHSGVDMLNVSTIKNRSGKMDASGQTFVPLRFNAENMQITDDA